MWRGTGGVCVCRGYMGQRLPAAGQGLEAAGAADAERTLFLFFSSLSVSGWSQDQGLCTVPYAKVLPRTL